MPVIDPKKTPASGAKDDYDSPWKVILEAHFQEFMAFFFPRIHADIDWDRGYEFLDTELQRIVRDAEIGSRFADKLVRVWRKNGDETWVLVHIEIQGYVESNFPRRMYVYNYRIFDRYDRPVVSLAILADDRESWRPDRYTHGLWGCETRFSFPVVKVLDYAVEWDRLEVSENRFAVVVMAHLKARETAGDHESRWKWKLHLIRRLYDRGLGRRDVIDLFLFIDWLMRLPPELERRLDGEIHQYEREKNMRYVSTLERMATDRGIQQGIQQGIRQGLFEAVELGLNVKFGVEGLTLMPKVRAIEDTEQLRLIKEALKVSGDLGEIEALLPHDVSNGPE